MQSFGTLNAGAGGVESARAVVWVDETSFPASGPFEQPLDLTEWVARGIPGRLGLGGGAGTKLARFPASADSARERVASHANHPRIHLRHASIRHGGGSVHLSSGPDFSVAQRCDHSVRSGCNTVSASESRPIKSFARTFLAL